jgi:hypothetical protein
MRRISLLLAILLALPSSVAAQGRRAAMDIRIFDASTKSPIEGARVAVTGTQQSAVSDSTGRVRVGGLAAGVHFVEASRIGYQTERFAAQFTAGDTLMAEVDLIAAPVALQGITAESERRGALHGTGFFERRDAGHGVFLTAADISKMSLERAVDIFRRVSGVRVVRYSEGPGKLTYDRVASRRGSISLGNARQKGAVTPGGGAGECFMDVYLDGTHRTDSGNSALDFPPERIQAIEVFRGPSEIPVQYNSTGSACGVILVWTR